MWLVIRFAWLLAVASVALLFEGCDIPDVDANGRIIPRSDVERQLLALAVAEAADLACGDARVIRDPVDDLVFMVVCADGSDLENGWDGRLTPADDCGP